MRLFGLTIARTKALSAVAENRGGWWPVVHEPFSGAWQRNIKVDTAKVLSFHAVFACMSLISSDIAKLRLRLMQDDGTDVWTEVTNPAYSPVLRRPNPVQNRIQFWETWILSKLMRGNTYVLKRRDNRGVVVGLYILDPAHCRPMVSDDGQIFYEVHADNLSGIKNTIIVPAREIIHDRMKCLFHPLVGISPLYANGLTSTQGMRIQENSASFFGNNSQPGGILTAPGKISDATANRMKELWQTNFTGQNAGKVAILGDGLKYEKMTVNAVDSQLLEQLKLTAEIVCSTFNVPPYKIGIGPMPAYNNIQALNVEYYSQCLQKYMEDAELCMDEGLEIAHPLGTEFDKDNLLRMDSITQMQVLREGVNGSIIAPNEARRKIDLKAVPGGDSPLSQQQYYSLAALAKRDAKEDPFASGPLAVENDKAVEAATLMARFTAYGVGVRAGAITPQIEDEEAFRSDAGLPAPSGPIKELWEEEPVRRPITLKIDDKNPAPPTTPPADNEDDAAKENAMLVGALVQKALEAA